MSLLCRIQKWHLVVVAMVVAKATAARAKVAASMASKVVEVGG